MDGSTSILVSCVVTYLCLVIALVWVYKLKMKIRELEHKDKGEGV